MEISRKLYDCLTQVAEDDEEFEIRFHDDYSGRCMYGARCFGVSGNACAIQDLYYFMHRIAKGLVTEDEGIIKEADDFFECSGSVSWDSLGMGTIYYFPDVTVEEEENEEDNEDE